MATYSSDWSQKYVHQSVLDLGKILTKVGGGIYEEDVTEQGFGVSGETYLSSKPITQQMIDETINKEVDPEREFGWYRIEDSEQIRKTFKRLFDKLGYNLTSQRDNDGWYKMIVTKKSQNIIKEMKLVNDFYNKVASDIRKKYFAGVPHASTKSYNDTTYTIELFSNGALNYDNFINRLAKNCNDSVDEIKTIVDKYVLNENKKNIIMSIPYNEKIKIVLESVEQAVDRKTKSLEEREDAPRGGNIHPATKAKLKSLFTTIGQILKSGNIGEGSSVEDIKAEMAAVQAQLKAEKSRQAIHGEYQKKLSEIDKEFDTAPVKNKKTAKVQPPAKAAEKKTNATDKKEMKKSETKAKPEVKKGPMFMKK